jgi:hypothetical protein
LLCSWGARSLELSPAMQLVPTTQLAWFLVTVLAPCASCLPHVHRACFIIKTSPAVRHSVVASGRRSLRQARSRCEWLRGREVAGLRVGSTTRPTLAPSVACAAPAGPPVEEKKQAVSPTPFFSLLFSTSFPQSSPKRSSVIITSTISVRQARLCVVSGAFSV